MCVIPSTANGNSPTDSAISDNGYCPTATPALTTTTALQILVVSVWARDFTATNAGTDGSF